MKSLPKMDTGATIPRCRQRHPVVATTSSDSSQRWYGIQSPVEVSEIALSEVVVESCAFTPER